MDIVSTDGIEVSGLIITFSFGHLWMCVIVVERALDGVKNE